MITRRDVLQTIGYLTVGGTVGTIAGRIESLCAPDQAQEVEHTTSLHYDMPTYELRHINDVHPIRHCIAYDHTTCFNAMRHGLIDRPLASDEVIVFRDWSGHLNDVYL